MSNTNSAQHGLESSSNFSGNPRVFSPIDNQNWAISDLEGANGLRSPHTHEALQAGSPHTPEDTQAGSPHTPATTGRSPHAPSPANSSTPSDAYVDAHSRQQQQEHHRSQQPLQEMGNNSLSYLNSLAPPPAYSTLGIAHSSYEQLPYPMPPPPQSYTVPWQDSEIQPQSSIDQMSPVTVLYSSSQNPGHFQSMSDGPAVSGPTPSDPPKGQAELADAYNRLYKQRRRAMIWGLSLAAIIIPTVFGCVFGLPSKTSGHDGDYYNPPPAIPTNVTSSMSNSSTFATTSTATIFTSTQPSAPAATSTDPMTCMQNCNRKFSTCTDACTATYDSCTVACGSDVSCEVSCGFAESRCDDPCFAAVHTCTC